MHLAAGAYMKRILKNQIEIMKHLNMQNTDTYQKSQMLYNAKTTNEQWESMKDDEVKNL